MKNKFLFLSATALLSTCIVMNSIAGITEDTTGSVTLSAMAEFTTPIRADVEPINFGDLDPLKRGAVTVNPNGTYSGNALINDSGASAGNPKPGILTLWGGFLSSHDDEDPSTIVLLAIDPDDTTITLYEDDSVTESNPNGTVCGIVDNITTGEYRWTTYDEITALEIKFGGILTIDSQYNPTGSGTYYCSGSTTITYVLNPQL